MQTVDVVIPAYNEREALPVIVDRLRAVGTTIDDAHLNIIVVDDGSTDDTASILRSLAATGSDVHFISFTRNYGKQIAMTAGLDATTGDAVVLVDADLQHPPEVVADLVARWQAGALIAYGRRSDAGQRPGIVSRMFTRLLAWLTGQPALAELSDFMILDRKVVDVVNQYHERGRLLRSIVTDTGFLAEPVECVVVERVHGKTKFGIRNLIRLAWDGVASSSTFPLTLIGRLGVLSFLVAGATALYAVYVRFFQEEAVPGWTQIIVTIAFLSGVQLVMLGVVGSYVGRIYREVRNRPLYVVGSRDSDITAADDETIPPGEVG